MPLKPYPHIRTSHVEMVTIAFNPAELPDDEQRIPGSDVDWDATLDNLNPVAWRKLREAFPDATQVLFIPEFDRTMTEMKLGFSITWLEADARDVTAQEWSTIDSDLQTTRQQFLTAMNRLSQVWDEITATDGYWAYLPLRH